MQEKVTDSDQLFDLHLLINDLTHIYDDNWSHLFVAFIRIEEACIQMLMHWRNISDVDLGGPLGVLNNSIVALLVVPVAALQEPQTDSVFIVIACWKTQVLQL